MGDKSTATPVDSEAVGEEGLRGILIFGIPPFYTFERMDGTDRVPDDLAPRPRPVEKKAGRAWLGRPGDKSVGVWREKTDLPDILMLVHSLRFFNLVLPDFFMNDSVQHPHFL